MPHSPLATASDLRMEFLRITRAKSFTYDSVGNVSGKSGYGGNFTYTYDPFNRMTRVSEVAATDYTYNALNQRVRKSGPGGTFNYLYGPDEALLAETSAGSSTMNTQYVWLDGVLIAMIRNNTLYYVHADMLGRPETVTNQSRAVVWRAHNFVYDRTVETDSIGGLNLSFPGQYHDAESGLSYNWNRYYDPSIGQYLQSDPLGQAPGMDTYGYAGRSPTSTVDPWGLDVLVVTGYQRTDSYNVAGHIAVAVTGGGIYSFGTDTDLGSSLTEYLQSQSVSRTQSVVRISTTPEQDTRMLNYLRSQKDDINLVDNCSFRTYSALRAGGVSLRSLIAPTPAAVQQVLGHLLRNGSATVVIIPIGGPIPDYSSFNP